MSKFPILRSLHSQTMSNLVRRKYSLTCPKLTKLKKGSLVLSPLKQFLRRELEVLKKLNRLPKKPMSVFARSGETLKQNEWISEIAIIWNQRERRSSFRVCSNEPMGGTSWIQAESRNQKQKESSHIIWTGICAQEKRQVDSPLRKHFELVPKPQLGRFCIFPI